MTLYRAIHGYSKKMESQAALVQGSSTLSYGQLWKHLCSRGEWLREFGPGARVGLFLPSSLERAADFLAVMARFPCAPLNPDLKRQDLGRELECLGLTHLLGSSEREQRLSEEHGLESLWFSGGVSPGEETSLPEAGGVALLLSTSGTTGKSKPVELSHQNLHWANTRIAESLELSSEDRCLGVMPLYHIHGLSALFATLYSGGTFVFGESLDYRSSLERSGATWYTASPALHSLILESLGERPQHSLRFTRSASSAMPRRLQERMESLLKVPHLEAYGMTEASPLIATNGLREGARREGSVGRPNGADVKICDEAGESLAPGCLGQIRVRGPGVACEGWLETGDLGYLDQEGFLFVTGRSQDLINRGGEKIAPLELERCLEGHPAVKRAACFPIPHSLLGEVPAAAVVLHRCTRLEVEEEEELKQSLRSHLARRLAHFKIPQRIEFREELPLTASGKLKRRDLFVEVPEELPLRPNLRSGHAALLEIWREVFERADLGWDHDFFALGGHSLLAARLLNRVKEAFAQELPLSAVFERPTPRLLSELLCGGSPERALTPRQQSQYFLYLRDGSQAHYHVAASLDFQGTLHGKCLEKSLRALLLKHPELRTLVRERDGRPYQVLQELKGFELPSRDLNEEALSAYEKEFHSRPFDLNRGPLYRFELLHLPGRRHILMMSFHHIIFDAWSRFVVRRDLGELYRAELSGGGLEEESRELLPVSTEPAFSPSLLARRVEELRDIPFLRLAEKEHSQGAVAKSLDFQFTESLSKELHEWSSENRCTLFHTLLTALELALSEVSHQERFLLAVPTANRNSVEEEHRVGFQAKVTLLPCEIDRELSFQESLLRTRAKVLAAEAYKHVPLERLLSALSRPETGARSPVQVLFAYQNTPWQNSFDFTDDLKATPRDYQAEGSKFGLTLYLRERDNRLTGSWNFQEGVVSESTLQALQDKFQKILSERQGSRPPSTFLELWRNQVRQRPSASALICLGERYSYSDLEAWSNRLAHTLREREVKPGDVVGLFLPRAAEYLVSILAVWKCGAAYLPLDREHPLSRNQDALKLAEAQTLICSGETDPELSVHQIVRVEDLSASGEAPEWEEGDLAYLITTSGSTGQPKGVRVGHDSLAYYVEALGERLELRASDRYLHTAPLTFSSSVRQFALPWAHGATVLLAAEQERRDPELLFAFLKEQSATVLDLVPSHWRACLSAGVSASDSNLRLLLSASEAFPKSLARECAALAPEAELKNMYGQTETSGIALVHDWREDGEAFGLVPIGRPLRAYKATVQADGELVLEGPGIARGYSGGVNFDGRFSTGDRVERDSEGLFHFRSRLDQQLKIRGFRVEPAELEEQLLAYEEIEEVMVFEESGRLGALVVSRREVGLRELREFLQSRLPSYMIPSLLRKVDALPRTHSGKLLRVQPKEERVEKRAVPANVSSQLQQIWSQVLGRERVELDENFFDLGGDSLLTIQVLSRARDLGIKLDLSDLFQYQTIRALSRSLTELETEESDELIRAPIQEVRELCVEMLVESGLVREGAEALTEVQLESSLRGQVTHNLGDIPRYAARLKAGILNGEPRMKVLRDSPLSAVFDGDNGPGQWVASRAMSLALEKAQSQGMGLVLCTGSNHFGAAGHYAGLAAERGLIALCTTNGPVILAPTGGVTPLLGNNPIAVGIPRSEGHPLVLDMALSVAPRGKIGLQLRQGKPLKEDWILDALGRPSTDLKDLEAGLGVPIGEHKGYGLALVMEILAGVLSGAGFGEAHSRQAMSQDTANIGHFFFVFKPELYLSQEEFQGRLSRLISQIKGSTKAEGCEEILLPGELEFRAREENLGRGVPLRRATYELLKAAAQGRAHSPASI